MSLLLTQLMHGVVFGMILLLLSLGLSLIFGVGGVVNFAHGALYLSGAYASYSFFMYFDSFVAALAGAVLVIGILGAILEVSVLRPIYDRDTMTQLIITFGLIFIIEGAVVNYYGSIPFLVPVPEMFRGTIDIGFTNYPKYRLFVAGMAALLTAVVWIVLEYTRYGMVLRASAYDREVVGALGNDVNRLLTATFVSGSALAGIAGALAAPLFTVHPDMGAQMIILVFIVVVVGGLGSFRGAVAASFVIGISLMVSQPFLQGYAEMVPYLAMMLILLARPRGLFGQEVEL